MEYKTSILKSYKNLLVWQKTQTLIDLTLVEIKTWKRDILVLELVKQLFRAVHSIGANIAEGYGRGSGKDFQRFLIIARGSLSEASYWLHQSKKMNLITSEKELEFESLIQEISKMLASFIYKIRQQSK